MLNKIDTKRILKNDLSIMLGRSDEGKTLALCSIIKEYKKNYKGNIYVFGMPQEITNKLDVKTFNSLLELEAIKNSIVIVDELGLLFDLEDRKKRKLIENILRLVNHNGNKLLLSGLPFDFKKFVCTKAKCFIYKSLYIGDMINGSNAKEFLLQYRGNEMGMYSLIIDKNTLLCYDGEYFKCKFEYNKEFDLKRKNIDLFQKKCK